MSLRIDRVHVYRDSRGQWRWTAKARNNETIARCGAGYADKTFCLTAVAALFPNARVLIEDE